MRVGGPNQAKFIGIASALGGQFKTTQIGLANVRAVNFTINPYANAVRHGFEIGKFIIRLQGGVGFAVAFYLRDFDQGLVTHAGGSIFLIHWRAVPFFGFEH